MNEPVGPGPINRLSPLSSSLAEFAVIKSLQESSEILLCHRGVLSKSLSSLVSRVVKNAANSIDTNLVGIRGYSLTIQNQKGNILSAIIYMSCSLKLYLKKKTSWKKSVPMRFVFIKFIKTGEKLNSKYYMQFTFKKVKISHRVTCIVLSPLGKCLVIQVLIYLMPSDFTMNMKKFTFNCKLLLNFSHNRCTPKKAPPIALYTPANRTSISLHMI